MVPDAKPAGANKWKARCPAHEDRRPSLSIAKGADGKVLLKCHRGCDTAAIVAALGLTMRDLFTSANGRATKTVKATSNTSVTCATAQEAVAALERRYGRRSALWTYHDANGQPVGVVVRWDRADGTKDIRPVSRFADGWRVAGMPTPRPLYGLPDLLTDKGPVIVVEGEKAADAGRSIGLLTTTSPHGAKAADRADWTPLAGRDVLILPDNDAPGEGYAARVAAILHGLSPPARVRILRLPGLPAGGDLVEYVAARRAAGLDAAAIRAGIDQLVSEVGEEKPLLTDDVWGEPQPIPVDLPPVMPFDYELLPGALRAFVEDVAERMQCPPDFPGVAILVALAGVVGKKLGIRPKRHDDWLVVPNLWGAGIGRPGIMKSAAIGQPFKLLHRLQVEAQRRHEQELRAYHEQCLIAEVRKKEKKRAIEEAVKKKKDPLEVAKQFAVDEPEEPTPRRYIVNDSTVEKLGVLLNLNPNGLTVFRDELMGLLRQLDKEGQEGARAFYLEAWDGLGTFTYDRIGRGTIHITSVTLSLMGGIQPGRLLDYLGAALKGGADDDGLLQRFQMMVYPDVAKSWRNVDRWPDTIAKGMAWEVFQRLDALDPAAVGAETEDDDAVPFLRFAPEAQGLFDDWRAELERKVRSGDEHPALESHLAKYRSLVPSLALLLHLADGAHGPVGVGPTRKAIGWAAYLESHARRIYAIVINSAAVAGKALAKRITKGELKDGFTLRDLYRKHWAGLSEKQAVEQAVDLLLDLGWLKEEVEETGGKPKMHYRINPALLTKAAPDRSAKSAKSPADAPFGTCGTDPSARFQTPDEGDDGETAWGEV
jgi:putative DNA primase/helicase